MRREFYLKILSDETMLFNSSLRSSSSILTFVSPVDNVSVAREIFRIDDTVTFETINPNRAIVTIIELNTMIKLVFAVSASALISFDLALNLSLTTSEFLSDAAIFSLDKFAIACNVFEYVS